MVKNLLLILSSFTQLTIKQESFFSLGCLNSPAKELRFCSNHQNNSTTFVDDSQPMLNPEPPAKRQHYEKIDHAIIKVLESKEEVYGTNFHGVSIHLSSLYNTENFTGKLPREF